jgi:hypothetical protein
MNTHLPPYDRFTSMWYEFLYDIWRVLSSLWLTYYTIWNLLLTYHMFWNRNEYANTSCSDAPVPPHFPNMRCEHHKEAHVKQLRHLSTATRAYYCCPYKSVSNNTLHVWILVNWTLTSFFSYPSRICVDSFSGLMDPRCSISTSFFPVWWECIFSITLFQVVGSSVTKSTGNDRCREGRRKCTSCLQPTCV